MTTFRNSFPYCGLVTHNQPKRFKVCIAFQIGLICFTFGTRIYIPGQLYDQYKLSYYFSNIVLSMTVLTAVIALLESYRTIEKHKLLIRNINDIDFYLNAIPRSQQRFLGRKILILYGAISIISTFVFVFIVIWDNFEGNFFYYIFPVSVVKLKVFQVTVWLDEFSWRMVRFNGKLQRAIHLRAFMNIKKIYLVLLDFNTLFHQCFECSLMFTIVCFSMDYINSLYWSLLPLLGFLQYKYVILCIPTAVTIVFQVSTLCRVCENIDKEVSFKVENGSYLKFSDHRSQSPFEF